MASSKSKILFFLKNNWLKLGIVLALLFIVFKKDFSFRINLNTPLKSKENTEEQRPVKQFKKKEKREVYTDNGDLEEIPSNKSSVLDQLTAPFLGKSKSDKSKLLNPLLGVDDEVKNAFIKRFAHVAITEREKYGIPASVIMANALLHSWSGEAPWTEEGNNYFHLPCTSDWVGTTGDYDGRCLRHYENAWTSFRDYSLFITTGKYASTFSNLGNKDHKAWTKKLSKSIFSHLSGYQESILFVIDEYMLKELDED